MSSSGSAWFNIVLSVGIVLAYELYFRISSRREPLRFARATHARMRAEWVYSLMQRPGNELLAIQTIRNSVMSATVTASTAMLALMGAVSLLGGGVAGLLRKAEKVSPLLTPHTLLVALLMVILVATFAFSAMAVRFFNHAGYMMTALLEGEARDRLQGMASNYMMRAGNYYSLGMRMLFWVTPVAVGLVNSRLMPGAAAALVFVLLWFDRTPEQLEGLLPERKP